ncbi:MAG: hypothetical protein ACI4T2_01690 [Christensenellales bacterium]
MDNSKKQKSVEKALYKSAVGYSQNEVVEEYSPQEDGSMKLSKKKVTKKIISPDISAAKVLLEHYSKSEGQMLENMSDEELEKEKQRLLKQLKESD